MKTKFEIGKAYQHNSGMQMFICGMADTIYHGACFIAEEGWNRKKLEQRILDIKKDDEKIPTDLFNTHELKPISMSKDAMENWFEIPKEDFINNNTSK